MKLVVFDPNRIGLVEGEQVFDVTSAVPFVDPSWPPVYMNRLIAEWDQYRPRLEAARAQAKPIPLASVRLEPPNPCPVHILAAPANYRQHIAEMSHMGSNRSMRELGFFFKAPASLLRPGGTVFLPKGSTRRFDHEPELAAVVGRTCKNVPVERALDVVFGYSCLMDLTLRMSETQKEERVMRKSFDTFTPMGPWIVTADEVPDPQALEINLWVNDQHRQHGETANMIVSLAEQIAYMSSVMTLHPGDVITTGTPEGVASISPGDTIRMRIDGVGELSVQVAEAPEVAPVAF